VQYWSLDGLTSGQGEERRISCHGVVYPRSGQRELRPQCGNLYPCNRLCHQGRVQRIMEGGLRNEPFKVTVPAGRLFPAHNTRVCSRSLLV